MKTQKDLSARGAIPRMPQAKAQAIVKTFPWLARYLEKNSVEQIYVSAVESALLDYHPQEKDTGRFFPCMIEENIYFLNEMGFPVCIEKTSRRIKFPLAWPIISERKILRSAIVFPESTVRSVINKLGEKNGEIRFLLSFSPYTGAMIVYQIPGKVSLKQWLALRNQKTQQK